MQLNAICAITGCRTALVLRNPARFDMKDVCMQPYDLSIVGAVLAGLFAARRMAEQGFSGAFIDRK